MFLIHYTQNTLISIENDFAKFSKRFRIILHYLKIIIFTSFPQSGILSVVHFTEIEKSFNLINVIEITS